MVILIPDCLKIFINNHSLLNKVLSPKPLASNLYKSRYFVCLLCGQYSQCLLLCLCKHTEDIFGMEKWHNKTLIYVTSVHFPKVISQNVSSYILCFNPSSCFSQFLTYAPLFLHVFYVLLLLKMASPSVFRLHFSYHSENVRFKLPVVFLIFSFRIFFFCLLKTPWALYFHFFY